MALWTNAELEAARRLYANAGFRLIEAEEVRQFGSRWISEVWRLDLCGALTAGGTTSHLLKGLAPVRGRR